MLLIPQDTSYSEGRTLTEKTIINIIDDYYKNSGQRQVVRLVHGAQYMVKTQKVKSDSCRVSSAALVHGTACQYALQRAR